jgi:hypothetical protein
LLHSARKGTRNSGVETGQAPQDFYQARTPQTSLLFWYGFANIDAMKRRRAYEFEAMENGRQRRDARRFAGACRFVFNKALALQQQNHEEGGKFIRYEEMARHLIAWKNDPQTSWLRQAPSEALQHALKSLDMA